MRLVFIQSTGTNPYLNIAVENYLVRRPDKDTVVLYLWSNHRTVVIGQNQNPYMECDVEALERDGGYVMRRRTGGGAVYHDDGNLNFSFVVSPNLYDLSRQFGVIVRALQAYGLTCEVSGRNDLICQGRKFSGNAFSRGVNQYLHHGTLLISGNTADMQRYLHVNSAKLHKHGVDSVRSRVVNLSELAPVTPQNIAPHLRHAFEQEYGGTVDIVDFNTLIEIKEVKEIYAGFASKEWIFGKWDKFVAQRQDTFDWGQVAISLTIDEAQQRILDVQISTDSLDATLADALRMSLVGASTLEPPQITDINPDRRKAFADVYNLIYDDTQQH